MFLSETMQTGIRRVSANRKVLVNPTPPLKVALTPHHPRPPILFNRDNDGFTDTELPQESLSKVKHRVPSSSHPNDRGQECPSLV